MTATLCPDDRMAALLAAVGRSPEQGLRDTELLLGDFPRDPRLHFLRGSLLAGRQDYAAARLAMRQAVDIAPDFAVARFQLGFLLLTSGEPHAAQEAWGPLHGLPAESYIRKFVTGLCHLIRDEFADTIHCLEEGMAANTENPAMNRDMQMIVDEVRSKLKDAAPASAVDFLLQQSALKSTRH
ncbi:MAG: hypothetical protein WDM91_23670 [Rhizomicrobium sp.]